MTLPGTRVGQVYKSNDDDLTLLVEGVGIRRAQCRVLNGPGTGTKRRKRNHRKGDRPEIALDWLHEFCTVIGEGNG